MKATKEKEALTLNRIAAKIANGSKIQGTCLVTDQKSAYFLGQARPVRRIMYAFYYYNGNLFSLPADKWVSSTCENPNCIAKEHLILRSKGRQTLTEDEKKKRLLQKTEQKAEEAERRELEELKEEFTKLAELNSK